MKIDPDGNVSLSQKECLILEKGGDKVRQIRLSAEALLRKSTTVRRRFRIHGVRFLSAQK